MLASAAILAMLSAILRACTSLSITQGPAIRKSGLLAPRRRELRVISRVVVMRNSEDSIDQGCGASVAKRNSPRSWLEPRLTRRIYRVDPQSRGTDLKIGHYNDVVDYPGVGGLDSVRICLRRLRGRRWPGLFLR